QQCAHALTSPDSVVVLKYSLDEGRTYTWNLVADQFIVNGRALRLSATYNMDAIDSDLDGNTQVRIRVRTSSIDKRAGEIIDSVKAGLFPVGSRRTNKAGVYDAMIDQLGKILTGQYSIDESVPPPVLSGQGLTNQYDANRGVDIPSMMNMMMPSMPSGTDIELHVSKIDTLLVPSANQNLEGTRGSVARDGVKSAVQMDTIYRKMELDSIQSRPSGQRICFMTVHSVKKTIHGSMNIIETSIVRDTRSGLLERVIERGFYSDTDGRIHPQYVAVAVIETDLTVVADSEGNDILTPPSMSPGSVR
ncbi:MAG: hypothetical protein NTX15_03475, partial [Candidatus Kapabacteria bacterium]|nr:hypothetical protein [Candidatus Kapabacteria bacterium]